MAKKPIPPKKPKKLTPTGRKISKALQGHTVSKATRAKISKALQGHTVSASTRKKISRSLKRTNRLKAAVAPAIADEWILGQNDLLPTCAAVAVANHRWLATGYRMSDEEILRLFYTAGGTEDGVDIVDLLEAAGCKFWPVEYSGTSGILLGMDFQRMGHTVVSAGDGIAISWGGMVPITNVTDAWDIEWPDSAPVDVLSYGGAFVHL